MKYREFLYSVNDKKFYWKLLLPRKGLKIALEPEDMEIRKVCLNKQQHLNMLNAEYLEKKWNVI